MAVAGRQSHLFAARDWRPGRTGVIVRVGMHYFGAVQLAVLELEHLHHDETVWSLEAGMNVRAVREIDRLHHRVVVEKSSGHDDAFFFIYQEKISLANGIIGSVHPGLELVAAVQAKTGLGRIRIARGLRAVVNARTRGIEFGVESSVVELQRGEVAVGEVDHFAAGHSFRWR